MSWKALFRTKSISRILNEVKEESKTHESLRKTLGVWDLTALGIAAVLGAGIFSTIGNAAFDGGPAVVLLFVFAALTCVFSALCYAEFASSIPVSGSAYTYAYASFGEFIAWIIGWDLVMEYAIGNIAVAISWSQYLTGLLSNYGIDFSPYLLLDYFSAKAGYEKVSPLVQQGLSLETIDGIEGFNRMVMAGYHAWLEAPQIFGLRIICDLPTLIITGIITAIVFIGIEESRRTSNLLVVLKTAIVLLVIGAGAFYVNVDNWVPVAPNGFRGLLKGVSAVFFAYIGFDAISTTAEECKNPQRDLPRGMLYSLLICTILYSLVALVITGMVPYYHLGVGDPLGYVFGPEGVDIKWICAIVDIGGIIALSSALLVFQIGQPRIWMAMSRDGLLPPIFSSIHPKYRTPWFSIIVTGLVVAIPSLFMNLNEVTDLTSIGTLFAFLLVCGGVLKLNKDSAFRKAKFKIPYINSRYIFPGFLIGILLFVLTQAPEEFQAWIFGVNPQWSTLELFFHRAPIFVYFIGMFFLAISCFRQSHSLIPVLGLASCGYLISELEIITWIRFLVWLIVGCFIYFMYGIRKSKLKTSESL